MNSKSRNAGKTNWFDLPVRDLLDAMSFYEGLLGWTFLKLSEPVIPDYWVIQSGSEMIGGLRIMSDANEAKEHCDAPVLYFTVDDLGKSIARAKELGAPWIGDRVDMGKDRGSYQWLRDRENNLIALWSLQ
jgi:predicted enzyme related to lactoylglutathione lyase